MNDMHHHCPQCLIDNCIDCHEPDCPGEAGMVPKKEGGAACMDGASMKLLTTMGLRICELENLIVRAAGMESDCVDDLMREARRIVGKKKEAVFDDLWRTLAEQGACDSIGGLEYKRVRVEWLQYTGFDSLKNFIMRRANIGPVEKKEGAV